jgi:peroxiredoxin Q/BCP
MTPLTEGDPAPAFNLPTDGDGNVSLAALKGSAIVLYFYPKDDTETCTKEAIAFSAAAADFAAAGAVVIGVSPDTARSHDRFRGKYDLAMRLAADPGLECIKAYGCWTEKTTFGRTYMGVSRDTFLIGHGGRIVRIWRKIRVNGHVDEVLAAVRAL